MRTSNDDAESPLNQLTPRESELLRKAGERVFALSKRLAEKQREADQLNSEAQSLRDLLAESKEVRRVLSAQVESMQTELDREYAERSELRRLLASLHVQMQELLPVVTGLSRIQEKPQIETPRVDSARAESPARERKLGFTERLMQASSTLRTGRPPRQRRR
ncbi:MAG: hypothetical protein AB7J35_09500 [Dehalococcoidia bacterium]